MSGVKDFWQEPAYAELLQAMQKRVHDYVVADQGTAQEAMDKLIEDWTSRSSRTKESSKRVTPPVTSPERQDHGGYVGRGRPFPRTGTQTEGDR